TNVTNPTSTTTSAIPVMIRIARNSPSMGPAKVEAAGGSHQCMRRVLLALVRGESEVGRLALGARHGNCRRLCAELLMPRFDGVRPRRQALDREAAVRARHGVEGIGPHIEERFHPAVHIALKVHHYLGCRERAR